MDVDNDPAEAAAVLGNIQTVEGDAPIRARANSSKAMLFYRLIDGEARIRKRQLRWRTAAGREHLLELSGEGHQVIAEGVHPSGARYEYPKGRKPLAELPQTTTELREAMLASVKAGIMARGGVVLSDTGTAASHVDPASVPQESLRAPSAERFAALVADLPNPEEVGREMWVDVLRAMRATAADLLDDAGEEAARQWSALHPSHDDSRFDAAWRSVAGPSSLGWEMLVNKGKQWGSSVAADESCLADFAVLALLAPANDTAAPDGSRRFGRLRLLSVHDAINAPPRRHLLKPLVAPGELSVWWGAPKSGKSFLLLRLVYGLVLGQGMWGMKARRACRVLYVAAEGEGGFKARVLALQRQLGDAGEGFAFVAQSVVIGKPGTDVPAVVAAAQATGADLVVVDTLARTFGAGDENTAQDMGVFIAALDRIRETTGAHVAVIHHGSKEGRSARGSGALIGAADLVVNIAKGASGDPNTASVEAAKDDADGAAMAFRLVPVEVGFDEDGAPVTTCIAEETTTTPRRAPRLSKQTRAALKALYETVQAEGEALPAQPGFPNGLHGITEERWRRECDAVRLSTAVDVKGRAKAFSRAFENLRDAGCIETRGGWVWQPPSNIS